MFATKKDFTLRQFVSFTYADKVREGQVESVKENVVTLKTQHGQFKSFSFKKIQSAVKVIV